MATSFAAICVPCADCSGGCEYVKAYFPIEVVEYFKGDQKWVYWEDYVDFFPEGVSPFQKESTELSLRSLAHLYGEGVVVDGGIDFRGCSRQRRCGVY